jgi:twitching motility two-component system response regulator PilG
VVRKNILIVEDHKTLLKLESVLLASRGYKVSEATDGKVALDYIENNYPDLVLLDVMLPGIDGFEVCQRIKSNESTRHIPVIMVSARNDSEDFARGEQAGADWYITKPFKSGMFVETVKKALSGDL